ncbi:hypothetical protein SALBM311S_04684 [Streptomyces alboniger]
MSESAHSQPPTIQVLLTGPVAWGDPFSGLHIRIEGEEVAVCHCTLSRSALVTSGHGPHEGACIRPRQKTDPRAGVRGWQPRSRSCTGPQPLSPRCIRRQTPLAVTAVCPAWVGGGLSLVHRHRIGGCVNGCAAQPSPRRRTRDEVLPSAHEDEFDVFFHRKLVCGLPLGGARLRTSGCQGRSTGGHDPAPLAVAGCQEPGRVGPRCCPTKGVTWEGTGRRDVVMMAAAPYPDIDSAQPRGKKSHESRSGRRCSAYCARCRSATADHGVDVGRSHAKILPRALEGQLAQCVPPSTHGFV